MIKADPHGNPIVCGEALAVAPRATALQAATAAGFSVVRELTFDALELRVVVLRVPSGTARSLTRLQALDPNGIYDFNHIYIESGSITTNAGGSQAPGADEGAGAAARTARIGLIDNGVDPAHEVFSGLTLHQDGCSGRVVPHEHGTAVASLMVGRAPTFHGAAPGSCGSGNGQRDARGDPDASSTTASS